VKSVVNAGFGPTNTHGPVLSLTPPLGLAMLCPTLLMRNSSWARRPTSSGAPRAVSRDAAGARWVYALDVPEPSAFVIGKALYLSHPLFQSPYLAGVVAHELGHLNSSDGRFVLGLNRLVIPVFHRMSVRLAGDTLHEDKLVARSARKEMGCVRSLLTLIFALMGGGIGVRLMTPLWLRYWRAREYDADRYAATLGQGPLLTEFLELYTQPFDLAIPYFDGMTHPYTELRIDKLELHTQMA
jgi:Zn-dependent protease with chaperone function